MTRQKKLILLIINIMLLIMEIIGTIFCFIDGGIAALRYYTVLSNIMCGVISIIYIFVLLKNMNVDDFVVFKWIKMLRFLVVVCLMVTFIVVVTVLIPTNGASSISRYLFERANLFHHLLCPLFMTITYIVLEKEVKLGRREEMFTLIPTILYAIVTLTLNILRVMEGPYPFLYVYEQSVFESIIWVVVIIGGAYALAMGLNKLNSIGGNK
ncbi:MAG: hypothetical protein E7270_06530 [Lachnospiraceae bacterium]|nr:hypothetical protein [Lachnospiraceae bacterium]